VHVTDSAFARPFLFLKKPMRRLVENVKPLLDRKRVPVMGGFIAATHEGINTTLGSRRN